MRKHYCIACKKKFKIEWWHVHTSCKLGGKRYYMRKHILTCPHCHFRDEISFWKMPFKAKVRFIKEVLSF